MKNDAYELFLREIAESWEGVEGDNEELFGAVKFPKMDMFYYSFM